MNCSIPNRRGFVYCHPHVHINHADTLKRGGNVAGGDSLSQTYVVAIGELSQEVLENDSCHCDCAARRASGNQLLCLGEPVLSKGMSNGLAKVGPADIQIHRVP